MKTKNVNYTGLIYRIYR